MNNQRFVEYFFRAGLGPGSDLKKNKLADISPDASSTDISQNIEVVEDKSRHPLSNRYDADTIIRYPAEDYSENDKYPPYTPMFCFPKDVTFVSHENGKPPDSFHSFVRRVLISRLSQKQTDLKLMESVSPLMSYQRSHMRL